MAPGGGCSELGELSAGTNPTRHVLDRQLVATLSAAGLQDGTTGAGAHARPKTVCFSPFTLVRLIRTLHDFLVSKFGALGKGASGKHLATQWGQSYPIKTPSLAVAP